MLSVIKSRALLYLLLFLSLQVASISTAFGEDTPTMVWERGREQNITLDGDTGSKLWSLSLVDSTGTSLPFNRSNPNSAGSLVYSIDLADGLDEGNYQIMTQSPDLRTSLVANVVVIATTHYNPLEDPRGVGAIAVVAFTILFLFSGTSKTDKEFNYSSRADGRDKWSFGRVGVAKSLDYLRLFTTSNASRKSKLMSRIVSDGAYFQSLFGPLAFFLPITAVAIGLNLGVGSDLAQSLVPTSMGLLLAVMVIGILDCLSGVIAMAAFALIALVEGRVNTLVDLRTLLALLFISFSPILVANSLRPIRRATMQSGLRDRAIDLVIATLLTGWMVRAMIIALDSFSLQKNPIAEQAKLFGLVAGAAITSRYLLEWLALHFVATRLAFLTPAPPQDERERFLSNLLIKGGLLLLFLSGIGGFTWQIFIASAILLLPTSLARVPLNWPNLPSRFQLGAVALPDLIFLFLTGVAISHWVNSLPLLASEKTKTILLLLSIATFVLSLPRLFARRAASEVLS